MKELFVDEEKYVDWFFGNESMQNWGDTVQENLSTYGYFKIDVEDLWDMCEDIPAKVVINRPKWWSKDSYLGDEDNMPNDFWKTHVFKLVREGTFGYPTKEEL